MYHSIFDKVIYLYFFNLNYKVAVSLYQHLD